MVEEVWSGSVRPAQEQLKATAAAGFGRSLRLRSLVALAVAALVLPVWSYGLFVSWQFARTTRANIEADGAATARGIASAASFRVKALHGTLRSLSESDALLHDQWGQLYQQAQVFAQAQEAVIGFGDEQGNHIFNTNAPFGTALPRMTALSRFQEALDTGQTQISDLVYGNVSQAWLLALTHPVTRADGRRFVIAIAFESGRHLHAAMDSANLPEGWATAVIDAKGRIAGRRPQPEFVGQQAPDDVRRVAALGGAARGSGTTVTGQKALVFTHPIEGTSWTVVVGVPETVLADAVKDNVSTTLFFGFLLFLVSISLAIVIANRFSRKFEALSRLALAYRDRSNALITRPYRVRELADLQRTLVLAHDERDRNEAELHTLIADKELLMQEVHHRVKNSLQLVRGVLSLQARSTPNQEAKEALEAASSRIITIANVHNHLYLGKSINQIMVDDYLIQLTEQLGSSLFPKGGERRIRVKAPHVEVRTDTMTSLGLIVTELVTNSAKYGAGPIDVQFHVEAGPERSMGVLAVSDRGDGFPENFAFDRTGGLGSRLIDNLVRSSGGNVQIQKRKTGSRVVVRFPLL